MQVTYHCNERNASSHDDDESKYLKHNQIVVVVTISPQQSAAQLRRNMQLASDESPGKKIAQTPEFLRCVQRSVRLLRAQSTDKQLQVLKLGRSSFGSLTQFADARWFHTLFDRNNDPADEFDFDLYSPILICTGHFTGIYGQ